MGQTEEELAESLEGLPTIRSQRRFLEVMSLVCVAYYWFHVTLPTRSALGGWPVLIGSTRHALVGLWIGLFWSGLRYGQQLYRLRRSFWKDTFEDFQAELSRLSIGIVRRYISSLSTDQRRLFGNPEGAPHFKGTAVVRRFNFERARRFDSNRRELPPKLPGGLGRESHSVVYVTFDWLHNDAGQELKYSFGISRAVALRLRFRATVAATLMRPAVFDYVTPVLLFAFALASLILRVLDGPTTAVCV